MKAKKGGDNVDAENGAKLMSFYQALRELMASANRHIENAGDSTTRVIFQARLEALEDVDKLFKRLLRHPG